MARTKSYGMQVALKMQKQLNTVAADLYGGANDVTLGADNLKLFDEVSIMDPTEKIVDQATNGTQADNYQETVAIVPTVEISGSVHTQGDNDVIVSALGFEALDGPKADGATDKVHMILLQERGKEQRAYTSAEEALVVTGYDSDDRLNPYFHIAQDLGPSTVHAKNVVLKGFEFSSQQKQELKAKFTGTAEVVTRDGTHATVSAWTPKTGNYAATFKHYQGAFSAGVVGGAASAIQILEFSVKGNFGLAEGVIPTGTGNGGLSQAEPLSDGKTEINVDFKVYKHDTDIYKNWENGDTKIFAKMVYTKGAKSIGFFFPLLQVVNAQMDAGEGGTVTVSCRGFIPTATDPFSVDRTISSTEWVLPFSTRMYILAKDADATNWMRTT